MWIAYPFFLDIIKSTWNLKFTVCIMFILYEKLKFLKNNLKVWNKETFGSVHHLVSNAEEKLNFVQLNIQPDGYSESIKLEEKLCMNNFEDALHKKHLFWKEKAKAK